jgi:hypothetical protein
MASRKAGQPFVGGDLMKKALAVLGILLGAAYLVVLGYGVIRFSTTPHSNCGPACQTAAPRANPGSGPQGANQKLVDQAMAKALGISPEELQAATQNGTSLPELAAKAGKTISQVRADFLNQLKAMLDQVVNSGSMSRSQADALLRHAQIQPWFGSGRFAGPTWRGMPGRAPGPRQPQGAGPRRGPRFRHSPFSGS